MDITFMVIIIMDFSKSGLKKLTFKNIWTLNEMDICRQNIILEPILYFIW